MGIFVREDNTNEWRDDTELAILRALEKIGWAAEQYAANLAPVDTARLRNSITHVMDNGGKYVAVGTNVEYAPYQELGTSRASAANGGRGYLRPAAQDHMDEYRKILEDELNG